MFKRIRLKLDQTRECVYWKERGDPRSWAPSFEEIRAVRF